MGVLGKSAPASFTMIPFFGMIVLEWMVGEQTLVQDLELFQNFDSTSTKH